MNQQDMSLRPTEPAKLGPGAMIFVVGPSGAGKDTLIDLARSRLADRGDVHFARRLVTRPVGAGEAHGTLSESAFEEQQPRFALWWRAHGLSYALGEDVADAMREAHTVVANGSRATLPLAMERFERLYVVHVTAPIHVRAQRLAQRSREAADDIQARLKRAPVVSLVPDLEIQNVETPEAGALRLAAFIARVAGA